MPSYGFVPYGNFQAHGNVAEIVKRLNALAKRKHLRIFGISGYRTPSHSVEVGGSANDPHTQGQAIDIGVGAPTRDSAAQLSDADLESVGLYRPFPGAQEINHIQLKPGGSFLGVKLPPHALDFIPGIGPVIDAATSAPGKAVEGAAADAAKAGFTAGFNALWDSVRGKAEYAGVFTLAIAAGAILLVIGISRSTGLKKAASA